MNVWITTSVLHSSQMILFPIASFAKFSCLHHRRSSQLFRAVANHRVSHFMAENNLKDFCHKKTSSSHRQLIVIFAEVKHSLVDKDVPAWKYKCVSGRLWQYDDFEANIIFYMLFLFHKKRSYHLINHCHCPLLVIDLPNIPICHQQLVRHRGNPEKGIVAFLLWTLKGS